MLILFMLQLVASIRNMVRQRTLLFVRLKVVKAMQSFISYRLGGSEDLRSRLERSETDLAAAQKAATEGVEALKKAGEKKEVFQVVVNKLKNEGEVAKAKLKKAEQETSHRRRIQNSFETGSRLKK